MGLKNLTKKNGFIYLKIDFSFEVKGVQRLYSVLLLI